MMRAKQWSRTTGQLGWEGDLAFANEGRVVRWRVSHFSRRGESSSGGDEEVKVILRESCVVFFGGKESATV